MEPVALPPAALLGPMPLLKDAVQKSAKKSRMHADDRHRQLLRVAIEVFARHGFSGTKTKDIAHAAGVSEAILFRHFATKEDLYRAILDMKDGETDGAHRVRQLQGFMDRRDDRGLFRYFATQVLASFAEDPAFQRLMMYASLEGHLLANLFRKRVVLPTSDLLGKYIALRQQEGAFRHCDTKIAARYAISTFVHFAMSRHVFGLKPAAGGDAFVLEELVQLVLAGLAEPGKPALNPKIKPNSNKTHSNKTHSKKTNKNLANESGHLNGIGKGLHAKS